MNNDHREGCPPFISLCLSLRVILGTTRSTFSFYYTEWHISSVLKELQILHEEECSTIGNDDVQWSWRIPVVFEQDEQFNWQSCLACKNANSWFLTFISWQEELKGERSPVKGQTPSGDASWITFHNRIRQRCQRLLSCRPKIDLRLCKWVFWKENGFFNCSNCWKDNWSSVKNIELPKDATKSQGEESLGVCFLLGRSGMMSELDMGKKHAGKEKERDI